MTTDDLDSRVRTAAFAFLEEKTAHHGEVLSWSMLQNDFRFGGERICLIGASGIWKPQILADMPISIATAPPKPGKAAPYEDGLDASGFLSYRYRGEDPSYLDNVGLREAGRRKAPLIYFFGVSKGVYLPVWPVFVVADDPASLTFTVAVDEQRVSLPIGQEADRVAEARRSYVTRLTVYRLHQATFRERVLRAYRMQCAICQLRHTELLDAAHILPDNDPRGEPIIPNGLALCKLHHAAYDRQVLGIRPDLLVEVRSDILNEIDGPMLRYGLQAVEGTRLMVPRAEVNKPSREFLEVRYEQFRRAS